MQAKSNRIYHICGVQFILASVAVLCGLCVFILSNSTPGQPREPVLPHVTAIQSTECETIAPTVCSTEIAEPTEPTNVASTAMNVDIVETVYEYDYDYNYDHGDRELLARVIYLEAGGCSESCQWLVGSAAVNLADRFNGGSIEATVTDPAMFDVAYDLFSCEPSGLTWSVADRILSGDRDYMVMAFRTNQYHTFGTPYTCVDNVYFSTF